jgi:hypothetical protein
MSPTELREAITGPAARAGLGLEPGLVETILADLGTEPGSLPLLSHALLETWRRRQSDTLTIDGYKDAGGIRQAIARTADTVFARLDPVGQGIAKDLFLRLRTPAAAPAGPNCSTAATPNPSRPCSTSWSERGWSSWTRTAPRSPTRR